MLSTSDSMRGVMVTDRAWKYECPGSVGCETAEVYGARADARLSVPVRGCKLVRGADSIVVHRPHPRPEVRRDTVRDIARFIEQLGGG